MKSAVVESLARKAIMVCSDEESKKAEFDKIKRAMSVNSYLKKF